MSPAVIEEAKSFITKRGWSNYNIVMKAQKMTSPKVIKGLKTDNRSEDLLTLLKAGRDSPSDVKKFGDKLLNKTQYMLMRLKPHVIAKKYS